MSEVKQKAFGVSASWYDTLYTWKDYAGECASIRERLIAEHPHAKTVLDVACGTGEHARFLAEHYTVEGLDYQADLLACARTKLPKLSFHEGDMRSFALGKRYDVILCLFSSIGYCTTLAEVVQTLQCFHQHLNDHGIVMVEPWFTPDVFKPGRPHMLVSDGEHLKICRMSEASIEDDCSVITFYYQVAEGNKVHRLEETHRLRLSTPEELTQCFEEAGFQVDHDPIGLMERGLFLARKAQ